MRPVLRAGILAMLASIAAGLVVSVVPAVAQMNAATQQFNEMRDSLGLGEPRAPIDFTERPPLVVPPTNTLPPPGTAADDRLPVVDPDIEARRKALSDPRRPVPPSDPGANLTGLSSRTYLIDPPAGMRDPDRVAADVTTDTGAPAAPVAKRRHSHKRAHPAPAE